MLELERGNVSGTMTLSTSTTPMTMTTTTQGCNTRVTVAVSPIVSPTTNSVADRSVISAIVSLMTNLVADRSVISAIVPPTTNSVADRLVISAIVSPMTNSVADRSVISAIVSPPTTNSVVDRSVISAIISPTTNLVADRSAISAIVPPPMTNLVADRLALAPIITISIPEDDLSNTSSEFSEMMEEDGAAEVVHEVEVPDEGAVVESEVEVPVIERLLSAAKNKILTQTEFDIIGGEKNELDDYFEDSVLFDGVYWIPHFPRVIERIMLLSDVNCPSQLLQACLQMLAINSPEISYVIVTYDDDGPGLYHLSSKDDRNETVIALVNEHQTHYSVLQLLKMDYKKSKADCRVFDSNHDPTPSQPRWDMFSLIFQELFRTFFKKKTTFKLNTGRKLRRRAGGSNKKQPVEVFYQNEEKRMILSGNDCGYVAFKYLNAKRHVESMTFPQIMLSEYRVLLEHMKNKIDGYENLDEFCRRIPGSYCIQCDSDIECTVEELPSSDKCRCFGLYCMNCYAENIVTGSDGFKLCGRCNMVVVKKIKAL